MTRRATHGLTLRPSVALPSSAAWAAGSPELPDGPLKDSRQQQVLLNEVRNRLRDGVHARKLSNVEANESYRKIADRVREGLRAPVNAPPPRPDSTQSRIAALTNQAGPGQLSTAQPVDPHKARDGIIHDPPGSGQGGVPQAPAATRNEIRKDALARANKALTAPRPGGPKDSRPTPSLLQVQQAKDRALAAANGSPASAQRPQQRPAQQGDGRGKALAQANKTVTARRPSHADSRSTNPSLLQIQRAKDRALAAAKPPPASRHVAQPSRNTARAPVYKVPQVRSSRQAYNAQPRRQPSFRPRVAEHRAPVYRAPSRPQVRYAQPRSQPRYAQPVQCG